MDPRSLGVSLTAYRLRGGDDGLATPAVPVAIESSRPDRLNKKIAHFGFILIATRAAGDLRGENGGQPASDTSSRQSGAPDRIGRMGYRLLEGILTVYASGGIPFRRGKDWLFYFALPALASKQGAEASRSSAFSWHLHCWRGSARRVRSHGFENTLYPEIARRSL